MAVLSGWPASSDPSREEASAPSSVVDRGLAGVRRGSKAPRRAGYREVSATVVQNGSSQWSHD